MKNDPKLRGGWLLAVCAVLLAAALAFTLTACDNPAGGSGGGGSSGGSDGGGTTPAGGDGTGTPPAAPTGIAVTGVSLNTTSLSLPVSRTAALTAIIAPVNAANSAVTWSSGNAASAAVDNSGVVTALAEGNALITVTTADGNKTAVCVVTVFTPPLDYVAPTGVSITSSTLTLTTGGTVTGTLTAEFSPDNVTNKDVQWSSRNSAVATVNSGGVVTAVGPGTAIITVTTVSGGETASLAVKVISAVTPANLTALVTAPVAGAYPVTSAITTTQYTGTVEWKTSADAPHTGAFGYSSVYKAVLTLEPTTYYTFEGVPANAFIHSGTASVANSADSGEVTITFPATAALEIEMVPVPGGTFIMGESGIAEAAAHSVTVSGFSMGKYEVTQELYQAVMGSNPSYFQGGSYPPASGEAQGKRPVEQISWYDAIKFCNTLSMLEGLTPAYKINGETNPAEWGPVPPGDNSTWNGVTVDWDVDGYRLPTEAEWEYACRAETTTAYYTGDTITDNTGWYINNSSGKTHQAGKKPMNAWGLFDMAGNVAEWCWDRYGEYDVDNPPIVDPKGPPDTGVNRVLRGGHWNNYGGGLRSASRSDNYPWYRYSNIGFRLVRP